MSRSGHREIDHTADLGFELWAEELSDLYAEGVLALGEICYERKAVRPAQQRRLVVEGAGLEESLVRWLQEIYLLVEAELWLTAEATAVMITDGVIDGLLHGEPFESHRHTIHTEIKAVTYHGLEVARRGRLWRATVIVDV